MLAAEGGDDERRLLGLMIISQIARNEPVTERTDPHAVPDITERISMEAGTGTAK
jgi:hypothetical protein